MAPVLRKNRRNNSDVASAYLYTGQALFEKGNDNYEDALKYFLHAYDILKGFTEESDMGNYQLDDSGKGSCQLILTTAITSVGTIYKQQCKFDEAIEFYQQALTFLIDKIGRKKHDVATVYNHLARTYTEQNKIDKSLEMYTKAKEIFTSIYGDQHPETASCYYRIGLMLREDPNRITEAIDSIQKARDRWFKEYGSDNVNVLDAEKCITELEQIYNSGIC
jgi:tetratricopeptide (TPR) repeat protein